MSNETYDVIDVSELEYNEDENTSIWGNGLLTEKSLLFMAAEPKCGKTYLAIDIALAISSGEECIGFPVNNNVPVLYVNVDDPTNEFNKRLTSMRNTTDFDTKDFYLLTLPSINMIDPDILEKIKNTIIKYNIKVIIFDTFRRISTVDENDSSAISELSASFSAIQSIGVAIICLHHLRKRNSNAPFEDIVSRLRGSGDILSIGQSYIFMNTIGKKENTLKAKLYFETRHMKKPSPLIIELGCDEHFRICEDDPRLNKIICFINESREVNQHNLMEYIHTFEPDTNDRTMYRILESYAKDKKINREKIHGIWIYKSNISR